MPHSASPAAAGGRHAAAAGGSAATSRSVRRLTLSKNRRYDSMSVITCVLLRELAWLPPPLPADLSEKRSEPAGLVRDEHRPPAVGRRRLCRRRTVAGD